MALPKFLFRLVVLALLALFLESGGCQAADLQRVALLPVVNSAGVRDQAVLSAIDQALAVRFHTALSSIVPVYHIIPGDELSAVLPEIPPNKAGSPELNAANLRYLSARLNADTVVFARVTTFRQDILPVVLNPEGDQKIRIVVAISVYYYGRGADRYATVRDYREYIGDWLSGDSVSLTRELMDDLLAKLPLPPPNAVR